MGALSNSIHSNELKDRIERVLKQWVLQEGFELEVVVGQARKPFEGFYTTTLAFAAAKIVGEPPANVAQKLAEVINGAALLKGMQAVAVDGFVNIEIALTLRIQSFEHNGFCTQNPPSIEWVSNEQNSLVDPPYWLYRALFLYKRLEKEGIVTLSPDDFACVLETEAFCGVKRFLEYQEPLESLQHWLTTLTGRENLSLWTPEQLGALKIVAMWLIKSQIK